MLELDVVRPSLFVATMFIIAFDMLKDSVGQTANKVHRLATPQEVRSQFNNQMNRLCPEVSIGLCGLH
jgi:hypothetical protein